MPAFAPEKAEHLLPTDQDIQFYQENGYWKSKAVLSEEELQELRFAMYQVYAAHFPTGKEPWGGPWIFDPENPYAVRKVDQSHWTNPVLARMARHPLIAEMAARLSGSPSIRLWHDQLLYKPPQKDASAEQNTGRVGWHQDWHYWQCASSREMLTGWVAFDDVTVERGSMFVVPGSHKWGSLGGDFFNQDMDAFKKQVEAMGHEWKTEPLELKAGEVSFHHCLTIHGSVANVTSEPRRSIVLHYQTEDNAYLPDSSCDNHMNAILMQRLGKKGGERFEGELWPQCYPPES